MTTTEPSLPPARPARLGTVALIITLIGLGGSLVASVFSGLQLGPLEERSPVGLSDTDQAALVAVFAAMGSQLLWVALALWGAVQGIVATIGRRGRTQGLWAIVLGFAMPIISFAVWLVLILVTSPLG